MADKGQISIEVVYALPEEQCLLELKVEEGTTVQQGIELSGILQKYPDIDLSVNKVGIYSKVCKLDRVLEPHDRIEIYRPLLIDPKERRRQRAAKNK